MKIPALYPVIIFSIACGYAHANSFAFIKGFIASHIERSVVVTMGLKRVSIKSNLENHTPVSLDITPELSPPFLLETKEYGAKSYCEVFPVANNNAYRRAIIIVPLKDGGVSFLNNMEEHLEMKALLQRWNAENESSYKLANEIADGLFKIFSHAQKFTVIVLEMDEYVAPAIIPKNERVYQLQFEESENPTEGFIPDQPESKLFVLGLSKDYDLKLWSGGARILLDENLRTDKISISIDWAQKVWAVSKRSIDNVLLIMPKGGFKTCGDGFNLEGPESFLMIMARTPNFEFETTHWRILELARDFQSSDCNHILGVLAKNKMLLERFAFVCIPIQRLKELEKPSK